LYENLYRIFHSEAGNQALETEKATPKAKNAGQEAVQLDLFANYEDSQEASLFSSYAGIENTDHLYQFIDNEKAQRILVQNLLGQKVVCFDTETTSLNEFEAELIGMSFSYRKGLAYYVPIPENREEALAVLDIFKPFFESEEVLKIEDGKDDDEVVFNISYQGNPFYLVAEARAFYWVGAGDNIIMMYEPVSRIVLFTFDYS